MNETLRAAVDAYLSAAGSGADGSGGLTSRGGGGAVHAHAATSTVGPVGTGGGGGAPLPIITDAVPSTVQFVDFIRELGPSLTHSDGMIRRRATHLLAVVIETAVARNEATALCPKPDHARALTTFFYERLADFPSVYPSLHALRALLGIIEQQPTLFPHAAIAVCKALFAEVHVQAMEQPSRQAVYELLLYIATSPVHGASLLGRAPGATGTGMGAASDAPYILEFAVGVVQAMDGEKDPRCLLVALRLAACLLSTPPSCPAPGQTAGTPPGYGDAVASYTQELFDVTACYFPITFTPPPNDPHGITRQALVDALRSVFAASPRMAVYVIPLLLEKLSSSVADAKRDALHTLLCCAPVYGPVALTPHLTALSDALREEVIYARREDGADGGVSAAPGYMAPSLWTVGTHASVAGGLQEASMPHVQPGALATAATGAGGGGIGLVAGAIGLNFSGSNDLHAHSGYGLYQPPPTGGEGVGTGTPSMPAVYGGSGGTASTAVAAAAAARMGVAPRGIADEALHAIAEITGLLSAHVQATGHVDGWHAFVSPLIRFGLVEIARAAESLVGRGCARILCAIAAASHHALASVLENVMPTVVSVHAEATGHHRLSVRVSVVALVAGLLHTINHGIDHPPGGHPFSKHVGAVYDMMLDTLCHPLALNVTGVAAVGGEGGASSTHAAAPAPATALVKADAEARCIAAAGLCDLAVRPPSPLLAMEQKTQIVEQFTAIFLLDDDDAVREACLRALCTMASVRQRFCSAVLVVAVPRLLAVLREGLGEASSPSNTPCASVPARRGVDDDGMAGPVTLSATQAEQFTDMHQPGLAIMVSRALYALGQLCCISNVRVQLTVVPQLLDLAIEVWREEEQEEEEDITVTVVPAAARGAQGGQCRGNVPCACGPAPPPTLPGAPGSLSLSSHHHHPAAGSAASTSPSTVSTGHGGSEGGRPATSRRGRYRLRCSRTARGVAAISMAVMETLGRFVATKARVGDSAAMDALVMATPEAVRMYNAVLARAGGSVSSVVGDGSSTWYSGLTDDACSVRTGVSAGVDKDEVDPRTAAAFTKGMQALMGEGAAASGDGASGGGLLRGKDDAGTTPTAGGFDDDEVMRMGSSMGGSDGSGGVAPGTGVHYGGDGVVDGHLPSGELLLLVPTLLYVLVDSTRPNGTATTPSAVGLFSPSAAPTMATSASPSPGNTCAAATSCSEVAAAHGEDDGLGSDAGLHHIAAAQAAWHAGSHVATSSTNPFGQLPVLSIRVRAAIELMLRTVATYATPGVQDALREAVTKLLLGQPPATRVAATAEADTPSSGAAAGSGAVTKFISSHLVLHSAPWYRPLAPGAPVEQVQTLAPLLKTLACSRKGAPVPLMPDLMMALTVAVFRIPCGNLTSCEDPQQRYRARAILEVSRMVARTAEAAASADLTAATRAAMAAEMSDVEGGTAHDGGNGASTDLGDAPLSRPGSVGRLQMEMQRCAVIASQAVGTAFNRAPATGASKPAFDACLMAVLTAIVMRSGLGSSTLPTSAPVSPTMAPRSPASLGEGDADGCGFIHAGGGAQAIHRARERGVLLLVWLTKGLAMRGHAAAQLCAAALVNVVTGRDVASAAEVPIHHRLITLAGQGLGVILADPAPHHPFHRLAGATVLTLYKQRLFAFVFSSFHSLQDAARGSTASLSGDGGGDATAFLVPLLLSLCAMATHLPQSVLLSEIDKVLPIVVRALEIIRPPFSPTSSITGMASPVVTPPALPGHGRAEGGPIAGAPPAPPFAELRNAVAISALFCLRMLIEHAASSVAPHLHSLVPVLLALSRYFPSRPTKPLVRATAIDCLRGLVVLPYHKLHPLKATLLAGLVPALDDPKRAVRRRAAACRNDWTTLAPSSGSGMHVTLSNGGRR